MANAGQAMLLTYEISIDLIMGGRKRTHAVCPSSNGACPSSIGTNAVVQELDASHTRQLKQVFDQDPIYVSTPEELEVAVLEGRHHIVVTSHLDMTAMPLRQTSVCQDGCASPLPEIRYAKSITVCVWQVTHVFTSARHPPVTSKRNVPDAWPPWCSTGSAWLRGSTLPRR